MFAPLQIMVQFRSLPPGAVVQVEDLGGVLGPADDAPHGHDLQAILGVVDQTAGVVGPKVGKEQAVLKCTENSRKPSNNEVFRLQVALQLMYTGLKVEVGDQNYSHY